MKVKHFRPFLGNDINICLHKKRLVLPVKLPQSSLDAVPYYGVAHFLAHGEADPGAGGFPVLPEQKKVRGVHLVGVRVELRELGALAETLTLGKCGTVQRVNYLEAMETERRLRPFALLLLITSLPFLVAMRTRKPWVLFLEILEGW